MPRPNHSDKQQFQKTPMPKHNNVEKMNPKNTNTENTTKCQWIPMPEIHMARYTIAKSIKLFAATQ